MITTTIEIQKDTFEMYLLSKCCILNVLTI